MAAGLMTFRSAGIIEVRSASSGLPTINPIAVQAIWRTVMDVRRKVQSLLTRDAVEVSESIMITMGFSDTCPMFPRQALKGLEELSTIPPGGVLAVVRLIRTDQAAASGWSPLVP